MRLTDESMYFDLVGCMAEGINLEMVSQEGGQHTGSSSLEGIAPNMKSYSVFQSCLPSCSHCMASY